MNKKTKVTICTRLRPKTHEELEKIADEKEMSLSELIRMIVENYVQSR